MEVLVMTAPPLKKRTATLRVRKRRKSPEGERNRSAIGETAGERGRRIGSVGERRITGGGEKEGLIDGEGRELKFGGDEDNTCSNRETREELGFLVGCDSSRVKFRVYGLGRIHGLLNEDTAMSTINKENKGFALGLDTQSGLDTRMGTPDLTKGCSIRLEFKTSGGLENRSRDLGWVSIDGGLESEFAAKGGAEVWTRNRGSRTGFVNIIYGRTGEETNLDDQ